MKITIDRESWLRGEGGDNSYLLRSSDRKMCCLGFLAKACGYADDFIINRGSPSCPSYHVPNKFPHQLVNTKPSGVYVTRLCNELMSVNDDPKMPENVRESKLVDLFASINITVEFV